MCEEKVKSSFREPGSLGFTYENTGCKGSSPLASALEAGALNR